MKSGLLIFLLTLTLISSILLNVYGFYVLVPEAVITGYENAQASFDLERQRLLHAVALSKKDSSVDSMALLASQHENQDCNLALEDQVKLTKKHISARNNWRTIADRRAFSKDSLLSLLIDSRADAATLRTNLNQITKKYKTEQQQTDSLSRGLNDTTKLLRKERQLRDVAEEYAHDIRIKFLLQTAKQQTHPMVKSAATSAVAVLSPEEIDEESSSPNTTALDKKRSWLFMWFLLIAVVLVSTLIWRRHLINKSERQKRKDLRDLQRKLDPSEVESPVQAGPRIKLPRELFFDSTEAET